MSRTSQPLQLHIMAGPIGVITHLYAAVRFACMHVLRIRMTTFNFHGGEPVKWPHEPHFILRNSAAIATARGLVCAWRKQ